MKTSRSVCLDLSRTVARADQTVRTGIDRVELAYLDRFLSDSSRLVHGLVRLRGGHVLLDRQALVRLRSDLERRHRRGFSGQNRLGLRRRLLLQGFVPRPFLARKVAQRLSPDVWYVNVGHTDFGDRVVEAFGGLPGARIAVMLHDVIPLTHPQFQRPGIPQRFARMLNRVVASADLVICNSGHTEADLRRILIGKERLPETCVAPLGVVTAPPSLHVPGQIDLERPVFTCIGTLEPRKNHALLLDVWEQMERRLPPSDVPQLAVIGRRGWADPSLFRRIDRMQVGGASIHEFNAMQDGQVTTLLQASAGLLFPSQAEGFGLPGVEAAALGVPVICSPLPVLRETLRAYPTYVATGAPGPWRRAIQCRARAWMEGDRGLRAPHKVPTWRDHFNIVLSRLC